MKRCMSLLLVLLMCLSLLPLTALAEGAEAPATEEVQMHEHEHEHAEAEAPAEVAAPEVAAALPEQTATAAETAQAAAAALPAEAEVEAPTEAPADGESSIECEHEWFENSTISAPCRGGYVFLQCPNCGIMADLGKNPIDDVNEGTWVEPSAEHILYLFEADYTECGGGFWEDYYWCELCFGCYDAEGNSADGGPGTGEHTANLNDPYPYSECKGGWQDCYYCTFCNTVVKADGTEPDLDRDYVSGTGEHTRSDRAYNYASCIGGWKNCYYCEYCDTPLKADGSEASWETDYKEPSGKHSPGGEKLMGWEWTPCGGGYTVDVFVCTTCSTLCTKSGNTLTNYWRPGDGSAHTRGIYQPYYSCQGGFEGGWYYCDECGTAIDGDGHELNWMDALEPTTAHVPDGFLREYTECGGGYYPNGHVFCEQCGSACEQDGGELAWDSYREGTGMHTVEEQAYATGEYYPCIGGYDNVELYRCGVCSQSGLDADGNDLEFIEPTVAGHKLEARGGVLPTTESEGMLAYWVCEYCPYFYVNEDASGIFFLAESEDYFVLPKLDADSMLTADMDEGSATLAAGTGVLDGVVTVEVTKLDESEYYLRNNDVLAYDITLLDADGAEVQPNGCVTVTVPVPAGFDGAKCAVYHVKDGMYVKMHTIYDAVANTLTFTTDGFSVYLLAMFVATPDTSVSGWQLVGDCWFYVRSGKALTGWQKLSAKWYYFDADGIMQTGFTEIDGETYYLNSSGAMKTGWLEIGGEWYYFASSGVMKTGWLKSGGKWYHFDASGVMQTGWIEVDGETYFMATSGAMKTGWAEKDEQWVYLTSSGLRCEDWLKSGGKWYYFGADGYMETGWQEIDGAKYYFTSSGAMLTGWQRIGGQWYYFASSGAMQTGWLKSGGKWYYMNAEGVMQTGWIDIGGAKYFMNSAGAMLTGWQRISGQWYYFASSGAMKTGWLKSGGKWYYLDTEEAAKGVMLSSTTREIDGVLYKFNASGVWVG